jgi:hypothetical protein
VLYGRAGGLSLGGGLSRIGGQIFTQVGSAPEPGDRFAAALAAGDFNGDGVGDLAAGAPTEGVFSTPSAGAVSVLYGTAGGLTHVGGQIVTPKQPGSAQRRRTRRPVRSGPSHQLSRCGRLQGRSIPDTPGRVATHRPG